METIRIGPTKDALQSSKKCLVLLAPQAVGEAVERSNRARLYHRLGYEVYVAESSQLRTNPEAFELLFLKNPFIRGQRTIESEDFVDGVFVETSPLKRSVYEPQILRPDLFGETERIMKIHYEPQILADFSEKTLLDLTISSYRLRPGGRDDFSNVAAFVRKQYPEAITVLRNSNGTVKRTFEPLPVVEEFPSIHYDSIYDYCDLAASCRRIVTLQTGSQYLAGAFCKELELLRTEEFRTQLSGRESLLFFDTTIREFDLRKEGAI